MPRRFAWHPRKDDCTSCDDVFVRGRGGEWCSTLIITRLTAEVARPDARQDGVRCSMAADRAGIGDLTVWFRDGNTASILLAARLPRNSPKSSVLG